MFALGPGRADGQGDQQSEDRKQSGVIWRAGAGLSRSELDPAT